MKNKHRGWQHVLAIIVPYLLLVGSFQYLGMYLAGIDIYEEGLGKTSEEHLMTTFFTLLGTMVIIWVFMKWVDKLKFIDLGFHTKNRGKDFLVGTLVGAVIMGLGYFILLFLDEINFKEIIFSSSDIIIALLVFFMVSVGEEVLLRGYVLRNFMISFNKYIALIASSLLFSVMHGFNPNVDLFGLFNIFLAGILLGISYIHTKNLWFPIALHFSWNLFQTLFGFNVSGQDFYSLVEYNKVENNFLNGGAFGFEGSVLSAIAMIIVIVGIAYYYNKKNYSKTDIEAQ